MLASSLAMAIGPIMGFYGAFRMLKISETFQQEMNSSLAIAQGVTPKLRKAMENQAMELSRTLKASAPELARAYYYLFSAGLKGAVALEAMPMVATFAQAAEAGVAESAERLTDALDALGLASKDPATYLRNLAGVADMLGRQAMNADATVSEFADSLTNKTATSLKTFEMPLSEGLALLGMYAMNAQKGEEAGTGFDIMLRNLTSVSVAAAAKLKGIDMFDENGMIRTIGMFEDIERVMKDMSAEEKIAMFDDLGIQDRARNRIMMLAGNAAQMREWAEANKLAQGTIQQIAEKQLPAFTAAWVKLKAVVEAFAIIRLGPFLQGLGEGVGLLLDISHNADRASASLDGMDTAAKGVSTELQGWTYWVGAVADAVHFLGIGWKTMKAVAVSAIESIVWGLAELTKALNVMGVVPQSVAEYMERLADTFGIMASDLMDELTGAFDAMKPSQRMLMESYRQDMEKLRRAAAKPWDTFASAGKSGGEAAAIKVTVAQAPILARGGSEELYDLIRQNRNPQKIENLQQQQLVRTTETVAILTRTAGVAENQLDRLEGIERALDFEDVEL